MLLIARYFSHRCPLSLKRAPSWPCREVSSASIVPTSVHCIPIERLTEKYTPHPPPISHAFKSADFHTMCTSNKEYTLKNGK